MKRVLIWDLENVRVSRVNEIFKHIQTPDKMYGIYKQEISKKNSELLLSLGFKLIKSNRMADDFIKDVFMVSLENSSEYILISSDSDFCELATIASKMDKNIHWILEENNQKRVLMKNNLTLKNIKYTILKTYKKPKKVKSNKLRFLGLGKSSKVSLEDLEEMSLKLRNKTSEEESINSVRATLRNQIDSPHLTKRFKIKLQLEKLDKIKEIVTHIIKKRTTFSIDTCICCGYIGKMIIRDKQQAMCEYCEKKFVYNFAKRKELNHTEKVEAFIQMCDNDLKEFGFIKYNLDELNLDLIQMELSRGFQTSNKYKDIIVDDSIKLCV